MELTRRQIAVAGVVALGVSSLLDSTPSAAASADEEAVAGAVEALRKAMVDADKARLDALVSDQLSYGHSSGKVETKAEFIDVVASKKTIYKSITLSEHKNSVVGNNAIARHIFAAEVESDGKPSSPRIGVMQVWLKQDGAWKLLARQAFRLA
jgi:hypothetical protein